MKPIDELKTNSPSERIYSDKIGQRRRALFPKCEVSEVDMDANPLNLDSECDAYPNISEIPSTELIKKILGTPERICTKSINIDSDGDTLDNDAIISSLSSTEILETPNDSNTHSENAPKLSRKSTSDKEDLSSSCNKNSKVRTTLFREFENSLSAARFYSTSKSNESFQKAKVSIPKKKILDKPKSRTSKPNKKLPGQINAGVRHKIRKKTRKSPKISKASVAHIKTYKSDIVVTSKFDEFFKDLEEINKNKQLKQIRHIPGKEAPKPSINPEHSSLKRSHDEIVETSSKKFKSNESRLEIIPNEASFEIDSIENELNVPIDEILDVLEESVGEDKENRSRDKEGILSPTAMLTDMTSGLKLSSPKKVRNLTTIFQNMADGNNPVTSEGPRYYPLFYSQKRSNEKALDKDCTVKKKKLKISSDQMLLDAGQKKFGLVECAQCCFVYNAGDPKDEYLHENHHNAINILQFNGWKNERIVEQNDGRIIQILPGDSKQWIDKVKRLAEYINREMGYQDMEVDLSRSMVFLYIFNKTIIGCVMAEGKSAANKILTANIDVDLCSIEEYPIVCGVSRLWIAPNFRKKGIATKLMETVRKHFLPNRSIEKSEMALSAPTPDGKQFATKYFETPNFYTYLN